MNCPFCKIPMKQSFDKGYWIGSLGEYWFWYYCPTCGFVAKFRERIHNAYVGNNPSMR